MEDWSKLKTFVENQVKIYSENLIEGKDSLDLVYKYSQILCNINNIELYTMLKDISSRLDVQMSDMLKDVDLKDMSNKIFTMKCSK